MFLVEVLFYWFGLSAHAAVTVDLKQAVEKGLSQNLEVLSAKMDVSMAEADEITAALRANPSLFIDSQLMPFSGKWQQDSSGGPVQRDIVLTVPLDIAGKRSQRKTLAKHLTEQKKIEFYIYQLEKSREIKTLFTEILSLKEKVKLLQKQKEELLLVNKAIKNRVKATHSQPLLAGRIDIYAQKIVYAHRMMDNLYAQKLRDFCIALGESVSCQPELKGEISGFRFDSAESEEALRQFIRENNPEIKRILAENEALHAETKFLRRSVWDGFSVSLGVSRQEKQLANPMNPSTRDIPAANSWMAGITMPLPIFQRAQGERQKNEYALLKNEKLTSQTQLVLENKVKSLLIEIRSKDERIKDYVSNILPTAVRINDSAQKIFKVSGMRAIEFLDANQVYIDSHVEYFDLVLERASLEYELQTLKGQI